MSVQNIERGDTFIVAEDMCRGNHYTCVGKTNDGGFLAGDTRGRMWKFEPAPGIEYRVSLRRDYEYKYSGRISAESIIKE